MDPLADVHYNLTPYNYVMNSPMNYRDPFGLDTVSVKVFSIKNFDTKNDIVVLDEVVVSRSVSKSNDHRDLRLSAGILQGINNIEYKEWLLIQIGNL